MIVKVHKYLQFHYLVSESRDEYFFLTNISGNMIIIVRSEYLPRVAPYTPEIVHERGKRPL